MKTAELTGSALDWAVAYIEEPDMANIMGECGYIFEGFHYSTNWSLGGPIAERERIAIWNNDVWWHAAYNDGTDDTCGQTPLIAAMRCYVSSKFGEEINIPEQPI